MLKAHMLGLGDPMGRAGRSESERGLLGLVSSFYIFPELGIWGRRVRADTELKSYKVAFEVFGACGGGRGSHLGRWPEVWESRGGACGRATDAPWPRSDFLFLLPFNFSAQLTGG